ncbi:hypothetical protein [Kitasatospora sp. NPDC057500]|uniref:hypothetical protein n=1 Tax=Kitasatospora sp. NPDC057500 TaxID=3346151 RepID=UPI0036BFCBE4
MSAETRHVLSDQSIKHLEFIQAVVTRLGNGSFLIKGWALTLAGAFLGFSANSKSWKLAAAGVVPLVGFWILDAYFLRQERMYRMLYDDVRKPNSSIDPFSMDARPYKARVNWYKVLFSNTLVNFYLVLSILSLAFSAWKFIRY